MITRRILALLLTAFIFAEARHSHDKRDVPSICDPAYNEGSKVQCYCVKDVKEPRVIISADCYLTVEEVSEVDASWDNFSDLKTLHRLTFANSKGIGLKYFPSKALKHTQELQRLDVKNGNIQTIQSFAFANLSSLQEISLRDSHVQELKANAFSHHRDLTVINLDKNNVVEIYRNVFVDLPSLEKLYLTSNHLTTIHDKAFIHLNNLKELEINMNKLFSLNSETFSGLKKLQKLDLSGNMLEVIGDNTFLPLKNLQTLNLEANKIQMLDGKAFNGLVKLKYLNLAHNKLSVIDDLKTFEGLKSIALLSLRANEIREMKQEVMAPILENFYNADASLDVEDNSFPCSCRLEWLMTLMNRTLSNNLKRALENLKCTPDNKIRELWAKLEESDKNSGQTFVEETQPNGDYEYYDESQLNGKLFYIDISSLLNCSEKSLGASGNSGPVARSSNFDGVSFLPKPEPKSTTMKIETTGAVTTKAKPAEVTTSVVTTKATTAFGDDRKFEHKTRTNYGVLDLSIDEVTVKSENDEIKATTRNEISTDNKPNTYTTSRLATVSAKPIEETRVTEEKMASDEAKPDNYKSHRSIQEELKSPELNNSANNKIGCLVLMFVPILFCFRL